MSINDWLRPARTTPGRLEQAVLPVVVVDDELTLDDDIDDAEPTEEIAVVRPLRLHSRKHMLVTYLTGLMATGTTIHISGVFLFTGTTAPGTVVAAPVAAVLWVVALSRVWR